MRRLVFAVPLALIATAPLYAQTSEVDLLRGDLARVRAQIDAQDVRLRALEARLNAAPAAAPRLQEITPTTNPPTVALAPVTAPAPVTAQATPAKASAKLPPLPIVRPR